MKIRNLLLGALCIIVVSCNADSTADIDINVADCKVDHQQSQLLVDRFNEVRQANGIPLLLHDTILDNICRLLVTNKAYLNNNTAFREDSVRQLLYVNGIIDYQFSIDVVLDKDTAALFNSFLLSDDLCTTHIGYLNYANKHIIFKTNNYLTFTKWYIQVHSSVIDGFSNDNSADVFTDSIACYLKTSKPDKYYCQFCDHIPLIEENLDKIKRFEVQAVKSNDSSSAQEMYDLVIGTKDADKSFIISDMNMKRIAVLN